MKNLIAYFSHTEENYNVGFIQKGNTAKVAEIIKNVLEEKGESSELFEIKPAKPYPEEYNDCINVAKKELNSKARPEIEGFCDVSGYDTIYLGYPNWWGDLPMCVYTFLEKCGKLAGKTIIPFCTHEGSGLGATEQKLKAFLPDADVKKGLAVQGIVAQQDEKRTQKLVEGWI